jgi:hypothetical protein
MATKNPSGEQITAQLRGHELIHVSRDKDNELALHFSDGTVLNITADTETLKSKIVRGKATPAEDVLPTKKQLEYLTFISKYISKFGRAPAESDIQRHFLVSAPSVNQMMQTLERRGFITRKPNTPRSTQLRTILEELQSKASTQRVGRGNFPPSPSQNRT